jgi:hypothetical protein
VFLGKTIENKKQVACFRKKGQRLVAIMSNTTIYSPSLILSNLEIIVNLYIENIVCFYIIYLLGNC